MTTAIQPSALSALGGGRAAASLNAQLARYEVQLADWKACPSCKTPQGKAKIAELSDKVREVKQGLADSAVGASSALSGDVSEMQSRSSRPSRYGALGALVDVYG